MQVSKNLNETVINQAVFSNCKEKGNFGCVIDLSRKKKNSSLSATFSRAVANLLAVDNKKIACLEIVPLKKSTSLNLHQKFLSNSNTHEGQGIVNGNVTIFKDENGLIGAGQVEEIKKNYSEFNKIICAMDSEVGDLTKFKFIEECDFYILIGRSSQFNEYNCKKFSNNVWEREKKCLGFFLID